MSKRRGDADRPTRDYSQSAPFSPHHRSRRARRSPHRGDEREWFRDSDTYNSRPLRAHAPPAEKYNSKSYDSSRSRHRHQDRRAHQTQSSKPARDTHRSQTSQTRQQSSTNQHLIQVATAALVSGVTEAVRARNQPDQSKRVVKAALGAAALNAVVGSNGGGKEKQGITKSAIGAMVINRLVNSRSSK